MLLCYLLLGERTWCLIQPVGAGEEKGRTDKNWMKVVFGCSTRLRTVAQVLAFDTHSVLHLVAVGYWRCSRTKTESYGWSPGGSASLGPDDSQRQ